jgi:putative ABC transport system substrate-binding protein
VQELLALGPDVILAGGGTNTARPFQQATSTVPIVFTSATDPVGGGLVASLARPGGNLTGLSQREFGLAGKSLELLKELAPRMTRVAVMRDPTSTGGAGQFGAIQSVAPSLKVELMPIDVRTPAAIERGITAFAKGPSGGMIATTSAPVLTHRKLLVRLARENRLPAIYPYAEIVQEGGLCSYGVYEAAAYRGAAEYVARILKGEKPENLPVQQPTNIELVVNQKAAREIGLAIPQAVLLRANRVIE